MHRTFTYSTLRFHAPLRCFPLRWRRVVLGGRGERLRREVGREGMGDGMGWDGGMRDGISGIGSSGGCVSE